MFDTIKPSNITTTVERVDIDGEPCDWIQGGVKTAYKSENLRLDNDLEFQVFYSPSLGHSLKVERQIWTSVGYDHVTTTTATLLNHRFTLLELKILRDTLIEFIDTAEADGFGEE